MGFLIPIIIGIIGEIWLYSHKKKGYIRKRVPIKSCPRCGYEFEYGVPLYCPKCRKRIWRPYRWAWVKESEEKRRVVIKVDSRNAEDVARILEMYEIPYDYVVEEEGF